LYSIALPPLTPALVRFCHPCFFSNINHTSRCFRQTRKIRTLFR
jgi:hypothetical protein